MKNLKLILSVLVLAMGAISFVNAENCTNNWWFFDCIAWQTCQWPSQCECDGSMINPWDICSTPCPLDGVGYVCSVGEYCAWPSQCECDGSMINGWEACNPSPTPPTASCSYLWQTIYSGQTMTVYQSGTVPYTSTCNWLTLTCTKVGSIGVLSPSYAWYNFSGCIVSPPPTWSCSLPWGWTIASWASITWFLSSSVPCNQSCWIQTTATCLGNNNWSGNVSDARYPTCNPNICVWWWGWGGSSTPTCTFVDLMCVSGTYQKKPGVNCINWNLWNACSGTGILITTGNVATGAGLDPVDYTKIWDISNSPYSQELNLAYLYAYNMWITTMPNIFKADLEWKLIRSHMAKMMVQWSKNVLGVKANTGIVCNFDDIDYLKWQDLYAFIIQSCQMWLMGVDNKWIPKSSFDPTGVVTRAQFGTVLSRAIRWDYYNGWDPFYNYHLEALNSVEIMKKISQPWDYELRGWVMLMLNRSHTKLVK